MHGELSGCYDRSVSDRNQLPDLTYEEISPWREREGKEREGASFGDETTDEDCEIEKERIETRNVSWICLCYSSLPSNY